ncbi:MAG: phosphoglycerate dehydrogenase [Anaerolineae bacterium]
MPRVLIADDLDRAAVDYLAARVETAVRSGLSAEALLAEVAGCDALVVRSSTKVTRAVIEAGPHLQVVGRAGAGVDNVDVAAATEHGVWVVNAPDSNYVAVAEYVFALALALLRRLPWAWDSLRSGQWCRGRFRGAELAGKTMGIIGLGRIGSRVAERASAFGMSVLAYDPFVTPDRAASVKATLVTLDDLLASSDVVTLHVPGTGVTAGLIGERQLARMKPGSYLVNCSRGSVVDEAALLRALDSGHLAGAALDVFAAEPPQGSPLVGHPLVLATPHLAGTTGEAQTNVAMAVAEQVLAVLSGRQPRYPVNAPALSAEQQATIGPHLDLARRLGLFYSQIATAPTVAVRLEYAGQAADMETAVLTAAALEGMLREVSEPPVNVVNARLVARNRGVSVSETQSAQVGPYSSLLTLTVQTPQGEQRLAGTVMHGQPYVVSIDDFVIPFVPAGMLLYTEHVEQPGILGRMGTLLGERGTNISFVQVGRRGRGGRGIMVLGVDDRLSEETIEAVGRLPSVVCARMVCLPPVA